MLRLSNIGKYTNQLYGNGCTSGQPRVYLFVVQYEQLVRGAPYADDKGRYDEHMEEHVK